MTVIYIKGCDDDDQAVLTEMLTVSEHDRPDVADAQTVDKYLAGRNRLRFFEAVLADLDRLADIADIDILAVHAEGHRKRSVLLQHLLLTVDRDKVLRLDQ